MKKILGILLAIVLVTTMFAACSTAAEEPAGGVTPPASTDSSSEDSSTDGKMKTIGVSLFYRRDEYYKDLDVSFQKAAKEFGYNIIIQDADTDPAKQVQQIEDFVQQGVDAIALAPADPAGLVPTIEAAVDAGVPVVTYDGDAETDKRLTAIKFDYPHNGKIVAEWVNDYVDANLGGTAKMAVIDFPQSTVVAIPTVNGLLDNLNDGIEIVAQQDGKATRSDSMTIMENILTANPDVQIVYGFNFDTAAGAKAAIESAGRDDIIVVGGGYGIELFQALADNDAIFKAFAVSPPQTQAWDTVAAIDKILKGETVPTESVSLGKLYTNENIGELDFQAILDERAEVE